MQKADPKPEEYFQSQLNKYNNLLKEVLKKIRIVSILRIITFLITITGIYILVANGYGLLSIFFLTGIFVFIYLIKKHIALEKNRDRYKAYLQINQDEMDRVNGDTSEHKTGSQYAEPHHPFSEDLDVFGKNSLFQLLNRSATVNGQDLLAHLLNTPVFEIDILKKRQDAIRELLEKPDWRQEFQVTGLLFDEKNNDQQELINWGKKQHHNFNTTFYKVMILATPILGFGIIAMIQMGYLSFGAFLLFLILPLSFIGTKLGVLNKIHADVSNKSGLLIKYSKLFGHITAESYNSELLININRNITDNSNAQNAIGKLAGITKSMDYRLNMIVGIFLNIFFLWDIRQSIRIEKWKEKHSNELKLWFDNLSQIDELQSLAGFAFINKRSIFPEFNDEGFVLSGQNIRHPFIANDISVGNPVDFRNWEEFHIITGANMAGKSTYLRTIGVNMLLAMTGTVVLADKFVITPVQLFTGIKTTDSLKEGESYFYAELLRLREIIQRLESGEKLFIILDEVLRGTNSADKQKGSMALISQLLKLGASGMIATHDLELGKLINEFPDNITNHRFEVEINNDELIFDYKLKDGISQNLNASFLMKKMKITL